MAYSCYRKAHQTPEDLILYMKSKNLVIDDELMAINFLENVNYYRFKIYLWPFLNSQHTTYVPYSRFEDGIELYRFDEELRNLLFSIICRIEIKLRSKLDQVVASHVGDPFWYLNDSLFISGMINQMNGVRASLASTFQYSKDDFSSHFKEYYYNETNKHFKQLPPFWVMTELATFGQIRIIYRSLDKVVFRGEHNTNQLDVLAHSFGAKNYKELNNWITAIRDVRNRCAHHSRVWNANLRQASGILNTLSPQHQPMNPNKIYLFCVLLKKIDDHLSMGLEIRQNLLGLFDRYPVAENKKYSAGFPCNWEHDPVWL